MDPTLDELNAERGHEGASLARHVPPACKWLGAFGVLPFVLLAIAVVVLEGGLRQQAYFALAAYGAVILSFLGGIHWGLSMVGFGSTPVQGVRYRRLTLSVVPSLVGWGALLLPATANLLVLAAAFVAMLLVDLLATRRGYAPRWYPKLRGPLTAMVVASLILSIAV